MSIPFDYAEMPASIRRRREALRWSQRRLAREAGIPVGQLAALERGEAVDMPVLRLQRLLNKLGADLSINAYNHGRPSMALIRYEEALADRGMFAPEWVY